MEMRKLSCMLATGLAAYGYSNVEGKFRMFRDKDNASLNVSSQVDPDNRYLIYIDRKEHNDRVLKCTICGGTSGSDYNSMQHALGYKYWKSML